MLARSQQVVRFDVESHDDLEPHVTEQVARSVRALAADADVMVVEDYNKGVVAPAVIEAVRESADHHEVPWVVDPKRRNFFAFEGATVFKPNANELADALGDFIHPEDEEWMEDARKRLGCHNLLLTLGDAGMVLQTSERETVRVPGVSRGVYDVSGAGDTVTAVVAVVLGTGGTTVEASILANYAAAIEVSKPGVATVTGGRTAENRMAGDTWATKLVVDSAPAGIFT